MNTLTDKLTVSALPTGGTDTLVVRLSEHRHARASVHTESRVAAVCGPKIK